MWQKTKGVGEAVADGLTAAVVGYASWTLVFQQPKVPVVHEFLAIAGTLGAIYFAVKILRSVRLTKAR